MHDPHAYFEGLKNRSYNVTSFSGYTNFATSASSNYSENNNNECQLKWYDNPDWRGKLIYKIEKSIPAVVQRILEEMGFIEWDEKEHDAEQWNLLWKSQRPSLGEFKRAQPFQKLIHIPKTGSICTKGNLARIIKKMKHLYGSIYSFTPLTFILPNEYKQVINYWNKDGNEKTMWICKPTDGRRGHGITIIDNMEDLQYAQQSVLQQYIANPMLIRGVKWDMRIYATITQVRPMKIYLYREGLVRLSTDRYDKSKLKNMYSHLTNSSINKYAHGGGQDGNQVYDNKWTIDQLKNNFRGCGFDFDGVWTKIEKIIILTCINLCSMCPNYENCFEIMGFDIMMDN